MRIGILRTDSVRPEWVEQFGEYPDMFERLLSSQDATLSFTTWNVEEGEYPADPAEVDGYVITGSKSSVYDDKQWIRDLEDFVRRLYCEQRKVVGICFGHQLIAKALGGEVSKSPKGWGVGVNVYQRHGNSVGEGETFQLLASHQDQVMTAPEGAEVIASNAHCEIAGLRLGSCVLTFQGHPEFIPEYAEEIMRFRHDMIGAERVEQGMASLTTHEHQGGRIARWILDFLRG